MICIACPRGCELSIRSLENGELVITGNHCKNGISFARSEVTRPMRYLTTTVKVAKGFDQQRLAVISKESVDLNRLRHLSLMLSCVVVDHPVKLEEEVAQVEGVSFLACSPLKREEINEG